MRWLAYRRNPRINEPKRRVVLWSVLLAATLLGTYVLERELGREEPDRLPFLSGDPAQGARLFSSLGCHACHSIFGVGQAVGPDLAKPPLSQWSPVRIVAEMSDHGPEMW